MSHAPRTEDECAAAGFVRQPDGSWSKPRIGAAVRAGSGRPTAELERNPGNGTLGARQIQMPASGRFLVRLTSVRTRLLDEDNLCEKYHVDCCRYAGLLPGDGPGTTQIQTRQEKAEPKGREFVRIEIFRVNEASVLI